VFSPTETLLLGPLLTLQLVVEGEFGSRLHVPQGEEPHSRVPVHHPLLGDAVRVTTVVHKPERHTEEILKSVDSLEFFL